MREGLISAAQLETAVRVRGRSSGQRRLGDILIELGYIDAPALRRLLELQRASATVPEPVPPGEPAPAPPATPLFRRDTPLRQMLGECMSQGVNDLLLAGEQPIRVRAHGRFALASDTTLTSVDLRAQLADLLTEPRRAELEHTGCARFTGTIPEQGRFRAMLYRCEGGLAATFRVLPVRPPTLSALGLPTALAHLATLERGLVLVAGTLASGKTSTAAALVDLINEDRSELIMTAEQLVEHAHDSKRSVVQQRRRRAAEPLERVFQPAQHRPSVLLVDPLHGRADLRAALRLADTGHLVFAVVRSADVISTLRWAIHLAGPDERAWLRGELARTLRAVICQRLLPRVGGGLVAAVEQMLVSDYLADIIRDGRLHEIHSVIQAGESQGMLDMQRSVRSLQAQGALA